MPKVMKKMDRGSSACSQPTEDEQVAAGLPLELIRLLIGIEHIDGIPRRP